MPTKTRINGENYTQVPRLVSDDIILKGLPNTPGTPAGYGDLVSVVNATVSVESIKSLTTNAKTAQSCSYFFANSTGAPSQWLYVPSLSKSNHNGVDILSPESIAAWDGTIANLSALTSWSGSGSGVFVKLSTSGADSSGAVVQESGSVSSLAAIQNMIDDATPIDISGVMRKRYIIDSSITYKSESALIGRDYAFSGTVIKPTGNFSAILPLVDGNAYTRFKCVNVMLECDNHTSVFAVELKNAFFVRVY